MPAARPLRFTLAATVPLFVPEPGAKLSQALLSLAVQVKVPEPVLETVKDWLAGLLPPAVPVKARLVVLRPMTGVAVEPVTLRERGMIVLLVRPLKPSVKIVMLDE